MGRTTFSRLRRERFLKLVSAGLESSGELDARTMVINDANQFMKIYGNLWKSRG